MAGIGDLFRMKKWEHRQGTMTLSFGFGRKKKVAVFVCLGDEPEDGSAPIDIDRVMKRLGWKRMGHLRALASAAGAAGEETR